MVTLSDADIETKEVRNWKGLHVFHFLHSTCSQKLRIFLKLKGLEWTSRHLDLGRKQHHTAWYMGINPRGLVPTLVHDGEVIIESNDILAYLDETFPEPRLIPSDKAGEAAALLKTEDDLHLDIRALTFRFVIPAFLAAWPEKELRRYEALGAGTVGGVPDPDKRRELDFWRDVATHKGVSDTRARQAFLNIKSALADLERRLASNAFILGDAPTVIDIAWYIYGRRLKDAGYPISELHPNVAAWFARLDANPSFHDEVPSGGVFAAVKKLLGLFQWLRGADLKQLSARWATLEPDAAASVASDE